MADYERATGLRRNALSMPPQTMRGMRGMIVPGLRNAQPATPTKLDPTRVHGSGVVSGAGNLVFSVSTTADNYGSTLVSCAALRGKRRYEATLDDAFTATYLGLVVSDWPLDNTSYRTGHGFLYGGGNVFCNTPDDVPSATSQYTPAWTVGSTIGIETDLDNGVLWVCSSSRIVGPFDIGPAVSWGRPVCPYVYGADASGSMTLNFGASPWKTLRQRDFVSWGV